MVIEDANRLPDPAKIDQFLRDRASVQKLQKSMRRAYDLMSAAAKEEVNKDYKALKAGKPLADFLNKAPNDQAGPTPEEKRVLHGLLTSLVTYGSDGLAMHPGYASKRELHDPEKKKIKAAIESLRTEIGGISRGDYDTYVSHVFGSSKLKDAKKRFEAGLNALDRLYKARQIEIDEMKKDKVWGCGGLTSEKHMALPHGKLDVHASLVTTLAHEMTHAMPPHLKTGDTYYRGSPGFLTATEERKLATADYYAEVMGRILSKDPGKPLVPRDASEKGVASPVLDSYRDKAESLVKEAWVSAINIHDNLQAWGGTAAEKSAKNEKSAKKKSVLDGDQLSFAKNASIVLGLTIHKRAQLSTQQNEISPLDLAIIDNKLNVLGTLLGCIGKVLTLPVTLTTFEANKVDHVLQHALMIQNGDKVRPGLLSKDIVKDVVVIRSLAALYDAPNWTNFTRNLSTDVPAPMKAYKSQFI